VTPRCPRTPAARPARRRGGCRLSGAACKQECRPWDWRSTEGGGRGAGTGGAAAGAQWGGGAGGWVAVAVVRGASANCAAADGPPAGASAGALSGPLRRRSSAAHPERVQRELLAAEACQPRARFSDPRGCIRRALARPALGRASPPAAGARTTSARAARGGAARGAAGRSSGGASSAAAVAVASAAARAAGHVVRVQVLKSRPDLLERLDVDLMNVFAAKGAQLLQHRGRHSAREGEGGARAGMGDGGRQGPPCLSGARAPKRGAGWRPRGASHCMADPGGHAPAFQSQPGRTTTVPLTLPNPRTPAQAPGGAGPG
jgi:hypothetical protein